MTFQSSATLVATVGAALQVPPSLTGTSIGSFTFGQGPGTQIIETSAAFAGTALRYSLPNPPPGVTIDGATGTITIDKATALSFTVVQVRADSAFGAAVTTDFNLTITATASPVDPAAFGDQELVIGVAVSIDASSRFFDYAGGGTLTYALQAATVADAAFPAGLNLPLGLSLDPATGQIAGTPCQLTPPMTVTVRATDGQGYTQTARAALSVTPKAGIPAPSKFVWTALPAALEAVFGWATQRTVSTSLTDLGAAIVAASNDAGTPARPKCHRITYTGPGGAEIDVNGVSVENGAIVHVVGAGQAVKEWKTLNLRVVIQNFTFYGGLSPSRAIKNGTTGMLLDCRIGGLYAPDLDTLAAGVTESVYDKGFCLWGCRIAGGENGPSIQTGRMALIDCFGTHFAIDGLRGYYGVGVQPFIYMYNVGNVFTHFVTYRTNAHGDLYQDGGGIDVTTENYENLWLIGNTRYGTTGWRSQAENAPRLSGGGVDDEKMNVIHKLHQNVMAITGIHLLAGNRVKWDIDGLFGMPMPNAGARGLSRSLDEPRPNISIANWVTTGITAAAIKANCPNVRGTDILHLSRFGNSTDGDLFISDLPQATFHPQAWRDYIATAWVPAEGWAAAGLTNPATYGGIFDWGTAPTWKSIVISNLSGSVSGTGCSGQVRLPLGISGGLLWISVTTSPGTPRWPQLLDGMNLDGTQGGGQAKPFFHPSSSDAYYGAVRLSGDGVQTFSFSQNAFGRGTTYYIHAGYEHTDGSLSNVATSAGVSY